MTIQEAIAARHSVRAYKEQPLTAEAVKALEEKVAELNHHGRLHMQLVQNEPKAFQGTLAKYGRFRGVSNYIAIGYGETQGVGHKVKKVEQVSNASDTTPSWFKKGVEAALLAPTAVNQQKFSFEYVGMKDGHHQVRAKKGFSMIGYTKTDLGIAKYHFEVGAGKENFEWV